MNNSSIEEYDITQAQKLLSNIRFISDLRKFKVSKPFTLMDEITMQEWVKIYVENIEWNGSIGIEKEVLHMIHKLDSQMQILSSRAEEGYRKLLMVLERRASIIKLLNDKIFELEKEKISNIQPAVMVPPINTEAKDEDSNKEEDKEEEKKTKTKTAPRWMNKKPSPT